VQDYKEAPARATQDGYPRLGSWRRERSGKGVTGIPYCAMNWSHLMAGMPGGIERMNGLWLSRNRVILTI